MNLSSFFNKKTIMILLAVSVIMLAVVFFMTGRFSGGSTPEITCTEGNLKVEVGASDKELMSGMIATDKEDGDITDQIIVESYSDFSASGIRNVTYAVMDSDRNVAKFARSIEYTDYEAPEFKLKANPIIGLNQDADLLPYMKAKDGIDGDLSGKIRLISSDVDNSKVGNYIQKYAVTNSAGDVTEVEVKVRVTDHFSSNNPVELTDYIIYIDKGQSFNYTSLVKGSAAGVGISQSGNFNKSGTCYVDYIIGGVTYARVMVVVR